jgi:peptide/nickel transport system permease protein
VIGYIIRRGLLAVPLLFAISIFAFLLVRLSGDPMSMYGANSALSAQDRARIVAEHGWDKPKVVQYFYWARDVFRGDWGTSLYTYRPVTAMIVERLPNTLILMGTVYVIVLLISIPLGVYSATHRYTIADYLITGGAFFSFALPTFWLGLVSIMVFSVKFQQWGLPHLPAGGMYSLQTGESVRQVLLHLVLPASVLAVVSLAPYVRYLRASMLEVLHQDYVRTARAKGIGEPRVLWKHAFRNALLSLVTLMSLDAARIFSGALVTEQVFAWPGMGRLFVDHAARADYPVLMGLIMSVSVLVIFFNLIADVVNGYIDPKIRFG